jgi:hypothetical protein
MSSIFCRLSSHRINRNRVWFDGIHNRTNCDRCGLPMIRDVTGWRPFDSDRDADPRREPHPNAQAE